ARSPPAERPAQRASGLAGLQSGGSPDPAPQPPICVEGPPVRLPGVALAHRGPHRTPSLSPAGASWRGGRCALRRAEAACYIG
ncbi:hypothetical protein R0J90_20435, partial [Micrococcus sp. SIMBA_144]